MVSGVVLCLAYILGLLSTVVPWGGAVVLVLGVLLAFIVPRFWRVGPKRSVWLVAGGIGLVASLYFQVRSPQPQATDISHFVSTVSKGEPPTVAIAGEITSFPRLTRSQKSQFWLEANLVSQVVTDKTREINKSVTGRLYVTVPLKEAKNLHPGQAIAVIGSLYLPKAATNPGAFDFKEFLAQEGSFAGLRGCQVFDGQAYLARGGDFSSISGCPLPNLPPVKQSDRWGWWRVRQQIVRSQQRWLGQREAPLVSAMVLGSKAVDLPFDIKDQFTRVGLAAALAASGFQTTLILGVLLTLTRSFSAKLQFTVGTLALLGFVGLTGMQPSILRAAVMGIGALIALLLQRKVIPLGSLLVSGVLLLLLNPLWIWDLGFQLSFLATMGLLVTVPPLTKLLDWLPSKITPLIAVPIAAYLWTLPTQLLAFGVLSPYSIPVNILTTPLVSLISIGGMVSALAALAWSPAGSAVAWTLQYPTQLLMAIVDWFSQFPGNAYATGTISPFILIGLYGLIALAWLQPWWQRHWWLALGLGVVLTLTPLWQARLTLLRFTVLATRQEPVLVVQDRGRVTLVNGGDAATVNFAVLPFLQKSGVNQIDWAIASTPALPSQSGWATLQQRLPIKSWLVAAQARSRSTSTNKGQTHPTLLPVGQPIQAGSLQVTLLNAQPPVGQVQVGDRRWLWLPTMQPEQQATLVQQGQLQSAQVLLWSGRFLRPDLLAILKPEVAIASANSINPKTATALRNLGTELYITGRDGAIAWTPDEGFQSALEEREGA
jgi:competence protein ComEC